MGVKPEFDGLPCLTQFSPPTIFTRGFLGSTRTKHRFLIF